MNPRILVVDDDPGVRYTIKEILESDNLEVYQAESGEKALSLLATQPVELVITDLRMPGMDGMAVLREIRSFNTSLPVVMVTGYPKEERMTEAISLGVSGFFPKTSSFEELGRIIKASIRTHKDLH